MNIKNLSSIAALCRTLPEESFNMRHYRLWQRSAPECGSVGCVLGHATILETGQLPRYGDGDIKFTKWSEDFTGLEGGSQEWEWCFGGFWGEYDNSPLGAAKRIEWLLADKRLPDMVNGPTTEMVEMYS